MRAANPEKTKAERRDSMRRLRAKDPELARTKSRNFFRRANNLPVPTRPCPDACELCGRPPKRLVLALDHDHETGAFRGWLCHPCNTALGRLGDNIAGLERAIAYLKRHLS